MGPLHFQYAHKVIARSRIRCRLLSSLIPTKSVARICGSGFRRWQGLRGVQLELEASITGAEEESMKGSWMVALEGIISTKNTFASVTTPVQQKQHQ